MRSGISPRDRAAPPQVDPRIGARVGSAQITAKIGQGGCGAVYHGREVDGLQREVAIKILRPSWTDSLQDGDPELLHRFQREGQVLMRLRHPGIVRLYDFGCLADGGPYLTMEYLPGESLQQRLKRGERFSIARTQAILEQLCDALYHVHQQGLIHRDLKPGNVQLSRDDQGHERAILLDFGIVSTPHGASALTSQGVFLGTLKYSAPEQIRGLKSIDHRADLYALGVLLCCLLCGRSPFRARSLPEMLQEKLSAPAATLDELAPHKRWAPKLQRFLRRALDPRPEVRPSDAQAFWSQCKDALLAQQLLERGASHESRELSSAATRPLSASESPEHLLPPTSVPDGSPRRPGLRIFSLAMVVMVIALAWGVVQLATWTSEPRSDPQMPQAKQPHPATKHRTPAAKHRTPAAKHRIPAAKHRTSAAQTPAAKTPVAKTPVAKQPDLRGRSATTSPKPRARSQRRRCLDLHRVRELMWMLPKGQRRRARRFLGTLDARGSCVVLKPSSRLSRHLGEFSGLMSALEGLGSGRE